MNYQVEKLEKNMVKFTIEVEEEKFETALERAYQKNKGKMSIQGFRKGKVPRRILEKMYGPEIFYEDAVEFIIPDAFNEAAEKSDFEVVAKPEIDIVSVAKGKPFIFTAEVAVKPEVTLGKYKGLSVDKFDEEITEDDVNKEIERARDKNARIIAVDSRPIQMDDIVRIDYEGFTDGIPFEGGKGEDYELTIGSHTFIDTFEDQLIGKNVGDEAEIHVTFPDEYHSEELKGKKALFKVKIHDVSTKELPDADDEFASEVSEFETLDEYKASIKEDLTEQKKKEVLAEKEDTLVSLAAENAELDIPEQMIQDETQKMMQEYAMRLQSQGLQLDQYMKMTGMTPEDLKEKMTPDAEKRLRSRLVLEKIAETEGLEVTQEELEKELEKEVMNVSILYRLEQDKVKEMLKGEGEEQVKKDTMLQKAIDFLVKEAVEADGE
ncbi:MAG: trigger factor [Lachnoclostridium sp.]|jgi:trigger factor|nr:trigger factor [Lachnoclostridium sp.]